MNTVNKSAGNFAAICSAAASGDAAPRTAVMPIVRDGAVTVHELIDLYMAQYAGRDPTRPQRLAWWDGKLGHIRLAELDDDHIHFALESLSTGHGRYWSGLDADRKAIYKAKSKPYAPATINRFAAALAAVLTWAIKKRHAPKGWDNPCKRVERRPENNAVVRYLSDGERVALLAECKKSTWPKLYLLVLLGLTTGARRGELEGLRWKDIDFDRAEAAVHHTKNGDRKVLPLVPTVVAELRRHEGASGELVFASTRRPDTAYNHVPVWHKALAAAGVRRFRFHDLRHSCASYLAQSGATLLEIADTLGHRNLSVTRRYSHLATDHKTKLINRVLGNIK